MTQASRMGTIHLYNNREIKYFPLARFLIVSSHCRVQQRGFPSYSQESHTPDSACSMGYDSRGSSPSSVLDGEFLHRIYIKMDDTTLKVHKTYTSSIRIYSKSI